MMRDIPAYLAGGIFAYIFHIDKNPAWFVVFLLILIYLEVGKIARRKQ